MRISLRSPDLNSALRRLTRASGEKKAGIRRALFRIGGVMKREAVRYAPISPTTAMLQKMAGQRRDASGRFVSKPASKEQGTPGGLMRSIAFASDAEKAEIFVPSNSEAGKYARKVHDDKGISWWNRGPGTIAKGDQADDKFIIRAIQDNQQPAVKIVDDEMRRVVA